MDDLLTYTGETISIIESQRGYAWGREEANDFWDDLNESIESKTALFLGTMVFDLGEVESKKFEYLVDGQQRVTTIILFLIACRQRAKVLNDTILASMIQRKVFYTDSIDNSDQRTRFVPSPTIRIVFESMASNDWDGVFKPKIGKTSVKKQNKLINPVYAYFEQNLSNLNVEELKGILKALYQTEFARIDIFTNSEALAVFERVNARGVRLVISDLLKNELFRKIPDEMREKWDTVVANADGTMERMLKYFYVSKKGYVQKKDLFRELKSLDAAEDDKGGLLDSLVDFSGFYKVINDGDRDEVRAYFDDNGLEQISGYEDRYISIHENIQALRLFKITQFAPVLYSAVQSIKKNGLQKDEAAAKKLIEITTLLEKYHFVNNAICDRVGNKVEKPYADFSKKFYVGDFFVVTKELIDYFRETIATESEFNARFTDIWWSAGSIPLIMYIFDRFSNEGVKPESRNQVYNPILLKRRINNVEHFYPRNPSKELQVELPLPENVDNIGNLMAIAMRVNSSLGNKSPQAKIVELSTNLANQIDNSMFVKKFVQEYGDEAKQWGDESIQRRASTLSKKAFEQIWKLDSKWG